jgi:hypothetical protein
MSKGHMIADVVTIIGTRHCFGEIVKLKQYSNLNKILVHFLIMLYHRFSVFFYYLY